VPSPGVTLSAAQALRHPTRVYTAAQVACLLDLAYRSGYRAGADLSTAETLATFDQHPFTAPTPHDRYLGRLTEMRAARARAPVTAGRPDYPGGPVDFDTGKPVAHDP
jgi:hypothetical protein